MYEQWLRIGALTMAKSDSYLMTVWRLCEEYDSVLEDCRLVGCDKSDSVYNVEDYVLYVKNGSVLEDCS